MILKVKDENGQFKEVVLKGLKGEKGDRGEDGTVLQQNEIDDIKSSLDKMENDITNLEDGFLINKNINGYTKFPNGLIIQWGTCEMPLSNVYMSTMTVTLPIAFPNSCLNVISNGDHNRSWLVNAKPVDKTKIELWAMEVNKGASSYALTIRWFAIGY